MKCQWVLLVAATLAVTTVYAQNNARQRVNTGISVGQRLKNWLSQQDKDKDGRISLDESTGLMKSKFQRNDTNKDGFLDREELTDLANRLARNTNQNNSRPTTPIPTDEQLLRQMPDGVTVEFDVAYRDGNDAWKLDLAKPTENSKEPRPAIVFVHGGGWTRGDKRTGPFIRYAFDYAAKGYVCVSVNYRLDGTKLPCIEDVKCAVRWLRAHADKYNIDADRIGAYGNSAGAHLVAMLGISHTEKRLEGDGPWQEFSSAVQAVAASATPTRPNIRGGSDEDRALIAPMSYISADVPPFFLVHEESDRTVNVSNSDDFVAALQKAGANDITYKRYTDGSGHGVFVANIAETGPAMEAFFAATIGKP